jgi:hypothetical protein
VIFLVSVEVVFAVVIEMVCKVLLIRFSLDRRVVVWVVVEVVVVVVVVSVVVAVEVVSVVVGVFGVFDRLMMVLMMMIVMSEEFCRKVQKEVSGKEMELGLLREKQEKQPEES